MAKTLDFAPKTLGNYELVYIRSGWAKVPGCHDAAMSEGEPLPAALASVCACLFPCIQLTCLHSQSAGPASEPISAPLLNVAAPLARHSPPSF